RRSRCARAVSDALDRPVFRLSHLQRIRDRTRCRGVWNFDARKEEWYRLVAARLCSIPAIWNIPRLKPSRMSPDAIAWLLTACIVVLLSGVIAVTRWHWR